MLFYQDYSPISEPLNGEGERIMSDLEFDVLDKLYFIQSYDILLKATDPEDSALRVVLGKMLTTGWIRCYRSVSDEIPVDEIDLRTKYMQYLYLASKNGLLAHSTSD